MRTGRAEYFGAEAITRFDRAEAQRGWDIAKGSIASELYSVVVLDELNPVLDLGLLPVDEVVQTLKNQPEYLEIIATGRAAPEALLEIADLHSEMKPHHHPAAEHNISVKYTLEQAKANLRAPWAKLCRQ